MSFLQGSGRSGFVDATFFTNMELFLPGSIQQELETQILLDHLIFLKQGGNNFDGTWGTLKRIVRVYKSGFDIIIQQWSLVPWQES